MPFKVSVRDAPDGRKSLFVNELILGTICNAKLPSTSDTVTPPVVADTGTATAAVEPSGATPLTATLTVLLTPLLFVVRKVTIVLPSNSPGSPVNVIVWPTLAEGKPASAATPIPATLSIETVGISTNTITSSLTPTLSARSVAVAPITNCEGLPAGTKYRNSKGGLLSVNPAISTKKGSLTRNLTSLKKTSSEALAVIRIAPPSSTVSPGIGAVIATAGGTPAVSSITATTLLVPPSVSTNTSSGCAPSGMVTFSEALVENTLIMLEPMSGSSSAKLPKFTVMAPSTKPRPFRRRLTPGVNEVKLNEFILGTICNGKLASVPGMVTLPVAAF